MIRYPSGKIYQQTNIKEKQHNKNKIELSISASNRGMDFEREINLSNIYYKDKGIALIYKRPTPINVVKVDYSKGAKITHAYFEEQSTTDYNGVYKGKYIDFEAKSTKNKTSFPLNNISLHQIEHLKQVLLHNGIAFFIINFELLNKIFLIKAEDVILFFSKNERKSIPISYFLSNCPQVKRGYNPRIDYIEVVDKSYF